LVVTVIVVVVIIIVVADLASTRAERGPDASTADMDDKPDGGTAAGSRRYEPRCDRFPGDNLHITGPAGSRQRQRQRQ
jgi:hypothetical protein